jgi:hypothetical protein
VETDIYRITGRPNISWGNGVNEVARIRKVNNLTNFIQDRVKWNKYLRRPELKTVAL